MKQEFETFEQVLGRDSNTRIWRPDFFLFYDEKEEFPYVCSRCCYKICIPYKGNESLKLTNNTPVKDEEVAVFDKSKNIPKSLKDAPQWAINIYFSFKNEFCSYVDIRNILGYKTVGSLQSIFSADTESPTPIQMGRKVFFPKEEVVLWLIKKTKNYKRRWRFVEKNGGE